MDAAAAILLARFLCVTTACLCNNVARMFPGEDEADDDDDDDDDDGESADANGDSNSNKS